MSASKGLLKLYAELEEPLNQALAEHPISCKAGCTHCCYMMTLCGVQEGMLMADKAMSSPAWKHYVRELRKGAKAMGAEGVSQGEYFQKKKPCVFLDKQGLCSVYDVRPSACRFYYVVSPPEDCAPDKNGKNVLAANTSMHETMVWKYETEASPTGLPVFAPLPMMVLHSCLVVAMEKGDQKRIRYVKQHLNGVTDPITWMESVNLDEMGRNTPETMEAYREAGDKLGLLTNQTGERDGLDYVQERLRQRAIRGSEGSRGDARRAQEDVVVLYDHTGKPFPQHEG